MLLVGFFPFLRANLFVDEYVRDKELFKSVKHRITDIEFCNLTDDVVPQVVGKASSFRCSSDGGISSNVAQKS